MSVFSLPLTLIDGSRARCQRQQRCGWGSHPYQWLLFACCLLLASVATADTGREQLQRMADAMRSLSYQGTFVYTQGERAETMRVTHGIVEGQSRERVSALTGSSLELFRHGDQVVCLLPEARRAIVGYQPRGLLPGALADDLEGLPDYYTIHQGDHSRVAGRGASELRVEPEDGFRYGLRLWLDREHDVLLRSDLIGGDGKSVERILFTEFEIRDHVDPAVFEYSLDGIDRVDEVMRAAVSEADSPGEPSVRPALPPGFTLIALDRSGDGEIEREHAVYSDGLASVSMFVDADASAVKEFPAVAGTDVLRMRSEVVGKYRVTVMGAVPAVTLEHMIDSLTAGGGS